MRKPSPMPFVMTAVVAFAATLAHAQSTATATTAAPATSTSSTIPDGPATGPTNDASSLGPDSSFPNDSGNTALGAPVDLGAGGVYGAGTEAVGGTAVAIAPTAPRVVGSATPLLDQATRRAEQREASRRATGNPPRIIGIAPRTDVDRTDEMPDDPIIRY